MSQIEKVFRKFGFYTTREYPTYEIKDGSGRAGRIDLVARRGKFRVAVEYDHHEVIKWKSFQKIVQIKPDVATEELEKGI
jgi:replicative superfamily II helicase